MEIVNLLLVAIGFFCLGRWWYGIKDRVHFQSFRKETKEIIRNYRRQIDEDTELIRVLREQLLRAALSRRIEEIQMVADPARGDKKPDDGEMN